MSNSTGQDPRIAEELAKHRLAPPSLDLQERVLRAARQAMETREPESDDVSWRLPVFRFASCFVIAVLLIFAGMRAGDRVLLQWQGSPGLVSDDASTAGLADAPFMVKLVVSDPIRSQSIAREQFSNYLRQVRELSGSY